MTAVAVDEPFTGALGEYRAAIEAYAQDLLGPYLSWLSDNLSRRAIKQFNDPVWGTVVLQPHEVVVLDSPLIQRLRRIRQLGVVHLVYPGANHTRFEHSLGVAHQVSQLARTLNGGDFGDRPIISAEWVDTIRLAGLMHDVGHGLMSHVVENALADHEATDDLLLDFKKHLKRASKPQLSEMAAFFLIQTPAVRELLRLAFEASPKKAPDDINNKIARIVVGKHVDDELPILHELISGPFDADKLDYMPRDAKMCGVPVVTDVIRLIQKVRHLNVTSDQLPEEMSTSIKPVASGHQVFGIARSGASALDEVSLNRSLMFDKVYRHHKVRAVESMVAAVVQVVHPLFNPSAALMPLAVMDDQFVELTRADLDRLNRVSKARLKKADLGVASDILSKIRDRDLFVRAFAFAQTMPFDAYRDDELQEAATERFTREMSDEPERRALFVKSIAAKVDEIATLLGERADVDRIGMKAIEQYIRVDPPSSGGRGSESDQSRAYLIDEGDNLLKVEKVRAENRGWVDAYVNTKDVGFIFAPREIADMVHVATEVAVRIDYGVRVPRQMHNYAKKGGGELDQLRKRLNATGFYDGKPHDLVPEPEYFSTVEAKTRIGQVLENMRGYMGPSRRMGTGASGSTLNETRLVHWAAQFPPEHHAHALSVASSLRLLTRDDANEAFKKLIEANPEFEKASFVAVGQPKDGSAVHAYFTRDAGDALGIELLGISDALRDEGPIVFVDDFVGLGRSAIDIFQTWMGVERTEPLNEDRTEQLDEAEVEALKSREIAVLWMCGYEDGRSSVSDELVRLGLTAKTHVHIPAEGLPTVWSALGAPVGAEDREAFVDECRRIARQLLAEKSADVVQERLLGYGNHGLLIATAYNTPSVALTALFAEGTVDGKPWQALIPRRTKH
jgi:deoxynucleoside triphosphate triphosphohydrolase SAMHD1